jgi:hypothetical protein
MKFQRVISLELKSKSKFEDQLAIDASEEKIAENCIKCYLVLN